MGKLQKELLIKMLRKMLEIRYFEEHVVDLYAQGRVLGVTHLYIGEEAVAVGTCAALRKDDLISSTHRGHGHHIAKGADLNLMMAELFAKKTGSNKGRGGSLHVSTPDVGSLGAEGIVGSGIPVAVGAALAAKLRLTNQIVVSFFGDGAADHGFFHEGLNFASVMKVPVIFICENNLYAIGTSAEQSRCITDIADRATSYGIPGVVVDGNDVIAVYEVVEQAVKRARQGDGPTLIECKTYRWRGHAEGDVKLGLKYRTREEMEEWKQKCPIKRMIDTLLRDGVLTDFEVERLREDVINQINKAIDYANKSPFPEPEDMLKGVFAEQC